MVGKNHENWAHRRYGYDSYRPFINREAVPKDHPERTGISRPQRRASQPSFPSVDTDCTKESEAQRRGIYGSPTSALTHIGNYQLKRLPVDEAAERSVKRRRNAEEERDFSPIAVDPRRSAHQVSQSRKPAPNEGVPSRDPRLKPSPLPEEVATNEPQMRGEPFLQQTQSGPIGVNATTPQISIHQAERQSSSSGHGEAAESRASSRKKEEDVAGTSGREDDHDSLSPVQTVDHFSRTFNRIKGQSAEIPDRDSQRQSPQTPARTRDHPSPHPPPTTSNSSTDRLPTSSSTTPGPAFVVENAAAGENDLLSTIDSRFHAFDREEELKQRQHKEELSRRQQQQREQLESELEEKIRQRREENEQGRQREVEAAEAEYERVLGWLRGK